MEGGEELLPSGGPLGEEGEALPPLRAPLLGFQTPIAEFISERDPETQNIMGVFQ